MNLPGTPFPNRRPAVWTHRSCVGDVEQFHLNYVYSRESRILLSEYFLRRPADPETRLDLGGDSRIDDRRHRGTSNGVAANSLNRPGSRLGATTSRGNITEPVDNSKVDLRAVPHAGAAPGLTTLSLRRTPPGHSVGLRPPPSQSRHSCPARPPGAIRAPMAVTSTLPHVQVRADAKSGPINFRELLRYRELLLTLADRDVRVRYKQTVLGVVWVVLQPLMGSLIFAFVFGVVARLPRRASPTSCSPLPV